jgi:predicted lysophospholipase L1 biosynthesis ABC-type transport system permease subunit
LSASDSILDSLQEGQASMSNIILGLFAGLFLAFATVFGLETISAWIYPLPPGTDLNDPASLQTLVDNSPLPAKIFVISAWFLGALIGGLAANFVSRLPWTALAIGSVVIAAGITNLFMIPHPLWMQIAAIVAPGLGGLIAAQYRRA